jgi:hypothetical protein
MSENDGSQRLLCSPTCVILNGDHMVALSTTLWTFTLTLTLTSQKMCLHAHHCSEFVLFVPCLAIPSMDPSHPTLQEKNKLREDTKEVSQRMLRERFPLAGEGIARKDEENNYSDRKERAAYIVLDTRVSKSSRTWTHVLRVVTYNKINYSRAVNSQDQRVSTLPPWRMIDAKELKHLFEFKNTQIWGLP